MIETKVSRVGFAHWVAEVWDIDAPYSTREFFFRRSKRSAERIAKKYSTQLEFIRPGLRKEG